MDKYMLRDFLQYFTRYYSAIEKKEILTFITTLMDLEGITSETSQKETDKYFMISFYVKSRKTELIETENRLAVARGGRLGGGGNG